MTDVKAIAKEVVKELKRGQSIVVTASDIALMCAYAPDSKPMLWEAIHDLNLVFLEKDLEKVGFPVKALECYKHWASRHNAE